ncbi:nucleotide exchange factor GrpE [Aquimarina longa]|uniref:nucleotide exchange factor GrpE n=1 Tax=Aquimarina longa TaxID=1080221 RepID=UPI000784CA8E|nr:nucleotide exchange factor GrpE [Aquimarina longa]
MSKKNKNTEDVKDQVEEVLDISVEEPETETEETETEEAIVDQETKLKEELDKEKDKFLRLFAEFENYKRRTSKERLELFKTASQDVIQSMLPVLDDFDRGLKEIEKSEDKNLIKGVELIHNKLKETLKSKGLLEVEVIIGDVFNADNHEAITQIPAPSDDLKGKIIDIIEKGYKLGDKIIRFPKVVTGQ